MNHYPQNVFAGVGAIDPALDDKLKRGAARETYSVMAEVRSK